MPSRSKRNCIDFYKYRLKGETFRFFFIYTNINNIRAESVAKVRGRRLWLNSMQRIM